MILQKLGGFDGLAGVEDIQVSHAAAKADHLTTQGPHCFDVFAFEVTKDQRVNTLGGESDEHPPHDGGLPEPGLAQDEGRGVGNQPGPLEPTDRVTAHRRLGLFMTAKGDTDHG
ncbi:hypothetical protein NtRootA4_42330 (plasmid) [Arthrobacter sp. NtRootA4]|nr:hypothetical protein NtRootA2_43030 [Arthrobacter sp. NtRootA2]BCW17254.1 hypothetical protein NtRootA4_42330 [Arthrobacter sp. NtRootA4]BCW25362.1 hypothetical protein NtRootC7_42290 [Arthrobacter sp. NtRootC7]BCW29565.1 hypothetical protein NtRootC45_41650 [Arthrobacter sp. NtRootC45]BCW33900.1 hypothetical protein NtRootD5_42310 [Arthrobacter sp. NtRootD5]GGV40933.1 hypothetical protein GCM10010212_32200 [Paenarthrobacter nicotinovorans]GLU60906.1 hypothetical protein Pure01_34190 [Paen